MYKNGENPVEYGNMIVTREIAAFCRVVTVLMQNFDK